MPIFQTKIGIAYFAHIPKCAGTTIEAHLRRRFGPLGLIGDIPGWPTSLQHITWPELQILLPQPWIARSFAMTRHPLSRFVSSFNMRLTQIHPPFPRETGLSDFFNWTASRLPTRPDLLDNHLRPQMDFLGQETRCFPLEDGLDPLLSYLDATFGKWSDPEPIDHIDHRPTETAELFEIETAIPEHVIAGIAQIYEKDFKILGYDMTPTKLPSVLRLKPQYCKPLRRRAWLARSRLKEALRGSMTRPKSNS